MLDSLYHLFNEKWGPWLAISSALFATILDLALPQMFEFVFGRFGVDPIVPNTIYLAAVWSIALKVALSAILDSYTEKAMPKLKENYVPVNDIITYFISDVGDREVAQKRLLWDALSDINRQVWYNIHHNALVPPIQMHNRSFTIGMPDLTLDATNEAPPTTYYCGCSLVFSDGSYGASGWFGVKFYEITTIKISFIGQNLTDLIKAIVPSFVLSTGTLTSYLSALNIPSLYLFYPTREYDSRAILMCPVEKYQDSTTNTSRKSQIQKISSWTEDERKDKGIQISSSSLERPCIFECRVFLNIINGPRCDVKYTETNKFDDLIKHYSEYFDKALHFENKSKKLTEGWFKLWATRGSFTDGPPPDEPSDILTMLLPEISERSVLYKDFRAKLKNMADHKKDITIERTIEITYPVRIDSGGAPFTTDFALLTHLDSLKFSIQKGGTLLKVAPALSSLCRSQRRYRFINSGQGIEVTGKDGPLRFFPADSVTFVWNPDMDKLKEFWTSYHPPVSSN